MLVLSVTSEMQLCNLFSDTFELSWLKFVSLPELHPIALQFYPLIVSAHLFRLSLNSGIGEVKCFGRAHRIDGPSLHLHAQDA